MFSTKRLPSVLLAMNVAHMIICLPVLYVKGPGASFGNIITALTLLLAFRTVWTFHLAALIVYIPLLLWQFLLSFLFEGYGWMPAYLILLVPAISGLILLKNRQAAEQDAFKRFNPEVQRYLWAINLTMVFLDFDFYLAGLTSFSLYIRAINSFDFDKFEKLYTPIRIMYALMVGNNILARAATRFESYWASQISINLSYVVFVLSLWSYVKLDPKYPYTFDLYSGWGFFGNGLEFILVLQVLFRLFANGNLYFASRSFKAGYKNDVIDYHRLCAHPLFRANVVKRARDSKPYYEALQLPMSHVTGPATADLEHGNPSSKENDIADMNI